MTDSSVIGKILIEGTLVLKSPLLIGDGSGETSDNFRDVHVLKNRDGVPFIPGTSLCGVLRDWLESVAPEFVTKIFGNINEERLSSSRQVRVIADPNCSPAFKAGDMQSSIQFDDIPLANRKIIARDDATETLLENCKIVARDGVRIDGVTGTGVDGGKYDFEVVERGASGNLRVLINLRGVHADENFSPKEIVDIVKLLMKKISDGIRLGALTSKGFGLVAAESLTANIYDFREKSDVAAWLLDKDSPHKISLSTEETTEKTFAHDDFVVEADFVFNSSFIVRDYEVDATKDDSTFDGGDEKVDGKNKSPISAVTLKSHDYFENRDDFVIPGTSLKGIFRHRAEYICARLGIDEKFLEDLMGNSPLSDKKIKSRFIVAESYVAPENFSEVAHTRNKIDRFTGGVLQGTLFTTKPAYQKKFDAPTLKIHFEIHNANDAEAGLAIFLLRDLWLGRIAIGGEKSIGRGTVSGVSAEINFRGKTYKLDANGNVTLHPAGMLFSSRQVQDIADPSCSLTFKAGDKAELETFAAALKNFKGGPL